MAGSPANLGSAYSTVGFKFDPAGYNQYLQALRNVASFQQQQIQAQQRVVGAQQAATGTTRTLTTAQTALARAQQAVALAQTDSAGKVRLLTESLSRLTSGSKDYLQTQLQLIRAEQAYGRERDRSFNARLREQRGGGGGAALPRTFAGITGAGLLQGAGALGLATSGAQVIQQASAMAAAGREVNIALEGQRRALGALLQDQNRANTVFQDAERFAAQYGFTMRETGESVRAASFIIQQSTAPIEDVLGVMARLAAVSPEQGLQGAAFAIRELASGDIVSLVERFEISRATASRWRDEIRRGADAVEVLDKGLNDLGIGADVLASQMEGQVGAQRDFNRALEDFQRALGELTSSPGWTEYWARVLQTGANEIRGARSFIAGLIDSYRDIDAMLQGTTRVNNDTRAALERVGDTLEKNTGRAKDYAAALERVGDPLDRGGQAATRRDATNVETDRQREREARITADVIAAGAQMEQATERRVEREADLQRRHARTVSDLLAELPRIHEQAQADIAEVTREGVEERAEIERDGAARIADFIAQQQLQAARQAQDRAIADARDAADYAERRAHDLAEFERQQAQTAEDFERDRLEREGDYRERRGDIIADYNENEVRIEEQHQRELSQITRQAQLDQYQATASYLERLYGLTRGRRRKGMLEQGVAAHRAAIEEARALVAETGDPAAGARLLAARQQQFLAGLEAQGQDARLRRDARRGGAISGAAAEAEIAAVSGARAEAAQAEIDFIKESARLGQQERTRQAGERKAALGETLSDLEENYTDQEQKQKEAFDRQQAQANEAFARRREQEAADRAELLAERDEDRRLEAERQAEDYARSLADLRQANADRLAEFDERQRERIAQIETHAAEQAEAIGDQIKAENTQYDESRAEIKREYDAFAKDLRENIDLSPTESARQKFLNAWRSLFAEANALRAQEIAAAAGQTVPGGGSGGAAAAGGTIGNRNPADDPRPADAALKSLFGPTARITSTYDNTRPVGQGVSQPGYLDAHGGLDVTMDKGSRVPAPFDMQILKVSGDQFAGGVTVLALDRQGHQWLFAHLHGVEGLTPGQWLAKGKTLGYIGAEGHVHVQERARNDASVPIDPTAHLMAAANPALAPARVGGVMDDSGTVSAQAMQNYQLYGGTAAAARPRTAAAGAAPLVINNDFSGAHFAPGVGLDEVDRRVTQGVVAGLAAYTSSTAQQTTQAGNQGPYR